MIKASILILVGLICLSGRAQAPAESTCRKILGLQGTSFELSEKPTNLRLLYGGGGGARVYLAEFGGRTVIAKEATRNLRTGRTTSQLILSDGSKHRVDNVFIESIFSSILDRLGIGPKFYGTSVIENKKYLVMDYVPDAVLIKRDTAPPNNFTELQMRKIEKQLIDIGAAVSKVGIQLNDFQFLLTPDLRVLVIDTEKYKFAVTNRMGTAQAKASRFNGPMIQAAINEIRAATKGTAR